MYNEVQKRRFINEYTKSEGSRKRVREAFNASEPIEIALEMDVCQMSPENFRKVINYATSKKRVYQRHSLVTIYYPYINWCIKNGWAPMSASKLIDVRCDVREGEEGRFLYGKPSDLNAMLDELFLPVSRHAIDNVYRCFFWLAYMGIEEAEMSHILVDDVDISQRALRFNGREYRIYDEAVEVFKECVERDSFAARTEPTISFRQRIEGDELLRGIGAVASSESVKVAIRGSVRKRARGNVATPTYKRVWFSGMLYRIWLLEKSGVELNFAKIAQAEKCRCDFDAAFGKTTNTNNPNKVADSIQRNYEKWKEKFAM